MKKLLGFVVLGLLWCNISVAGTKKQNLAHLKLTKQCEQCDLEGVSLKGVNLNEANLFKANLKNTNLKGVKLYAANLTGANLKDSNLMKADLMEAMPVSYTHLTLPTILLV